MAFYSAPFTFDFAESLIAVDAGASHVDCIALYEAIKRAQASEVGIAFPRIAAGSGLTQIAPGVRTGLTVFLLGGWRLKFPPGDYVATIDGGNLLGGPNGDPLAPSPGVTIVLVQSASATLIDVGEATAAGVWDTPLSTQNAPGSAGEALARIRNNTSLIPSLF